MGVEKQILANGPLTAQPLQPLHLHIDLNINDIIAHSESDREDEDPSTN